MVEFVGHGTQTGFDIAQALAKRELPKRQTQELIATRKTTLSPVASVSSHASVELVSRDEIHELRKNQFSRMHQAPSHQYLKINTVAGRLPN
jgi:hypothetical protein